MIKLYNADCLEVLKTIENENCIIVSDPPFNIGYHYIGYRDNLEYDEYYDLLKKVFYNYRHVIIHYPEEIYKHAFNIGELPYKVISWVYNSNTAKQHRDIAFFGIKPDMRKGKQEYKNPNDKRIMKRIAEGKTERLYDWWEINQVKNVSKDKTKHPCQMPLPVMDNIIQILPEDLTIVDPFMGSGTTGVACVKNNRHFIGIEKVKEYYDIAVKRIQDAGGNVIQQILPTNPLK